MNCKIYLAPLIEMTFIRPHRLLCTRSKIFVDLADFVGNGLLVIFPFGQISQLLVKFLGCIPSRPLRMASWGSLAFKWPNLRCQSAFGWVVLLVPVSSTTAISLTDSSTMYRPFVLFAINVAVLIYYEPSVFVKQDIVAMVGDPGHWEKVHP